jgi:hypothetical protein
MERSRPMKGKRKPNSRISYEEACQSNRGGLIPRGKVVQNMQ